MIYGNDFILETQNRLSQTLNPKRYMHTLGVAYTAAAISMAYGRDPNAAFVAGLLHDCAKCIDDDRLYELCLENGIEVSEAENRMRFLLHAKYGAFLAEHEYGIKDNDILNAVRFHTTGRGNMSFLEKVVYIADFIEPSRSFKAVNPLADLRKLVFTDLEKTIVLIIEDLFEFKNYPEDKEAMDPNSLEAYEYYNQLVQKQTY